MRPYEKTQKYLQAEAVKRILIFDGPRGTMIQNRDPSEQEFRGERFGAHPVALRGNNDILNLTQPQIITEIFEAFFDAGSDFIGTNTFNATSISQADYETQDFAYEINLAGAQIAREVADRRTEVTPDKPRFVCGALGPMNKTLSLSPDVNDPGYRAVSFDQVHGSYKEAARGLVEGGVDILLLETIFDTLNCKAALVAIDELRAETGADVPVMISGTITDLSGRTLSGQTVEAFWNSVRHARPFSIGLNCSMGAEQMRPYVSELSRIADCLICTYPNAGLPNEFGEYDQTPDEMAALLREWAESGFVNIMGGCCGSTPDHIAAIARAVEDVPPRDLPHVETSMRLSGLEPVIIAS